MKDWNPKEVAKIFNKYKKEKKFFDQLAKQLPGWEKQYADKRFVKWLDDNDVLKKKIDAKTYPQAVITAGNPTCGRTQLRKAFERYDVEQVVDIFNTYKKERKFMAQMSEYFPDWKKQNTDKIFLRWLHADKFFYPEYSKAMKNYDAKVISEIFKIHRNIQRIIVYLNKAFPGWEKIESSEGFSRWLKENDAFWNNQLGKAITEGNEKKAEFIIRKYCEETGTF